MLKQSKTTQDKAYDIWLKTGSKQDTQRLFEVIRLLLPEVAEKLELKEGWFQWKYQLASKAPLTADEATNLGNLLGKQLVNQR